MSSIGTGILLGITDSPEDASVLEEAAQYPNAGAAKELISYHQRGVNVFFTVMWGVIIFFAIFMIAAIIQFIYIMCTGQFQHHVRESNMGVYIFCVIAVIVLLLVMIVLLVCLMGCRSALVDSTDDKVPAVYSSTFDNLRKFVRVTAVESSRVDDRSPRVKLCVSSPPTILTQPPTVIAAPSRVLTKSTTVLTQQPKVVTQQPTLLTANAPSVLAPPPPTVPLVVPPPPPAPPVTTSPVGSGPAENQQAATAHMTINFYGSPAGGAFTMPMTGYPLGYPTTGYVAAAGQPYYYAAAPVGYAATAPAATPTVAAAQPASFAAPACQYAYAVPQPQSVSTHSVSTRSVCSRPSSPVVTRVPAATTVTAQPARTQLYAVPPP
ncbi:hypothetical protein V5799_008801 [Amblyomma americanum]|uniref:Uncharacterized protein n=1 Tax=Amblyomma americanum TaxID=6943 RepID=A0AAQ4FDA2_AMBAM